MSYLHVYVNLFNIHSIFQFNSKAWIVKSCLILQLCDLPHCFKQYLTSIPIWPFSLFITLCNRTPCVLWHKISLPIYVALDRFHCITERRMFLRRPLTWRWRWSRRAEPPPWPSGSPSAPPSPPARPFSAAPLISSVASSLSLSKTAKKKERIWKSKLHWMHIQIRR